MRKMIVCSSFVPKWSVKLCRFQTLRKKNKNKNKNKQKNQRNSNLSSKIQSPYKKFSCRVYLLIYRGASIEKIVEIITNNPTLLWGGLSLPPWSGRSKKLSWYKTTSPNDKRMATEDRSSTFCWQLTEVLYMQLFWWDCCCTGRKILHWPVWSGEI